MLIAGLLATGGQLAEGWVEVAGSRVARTGSGAAPGAPDVAHGGVVAPGLVDLQVNGAAGVDVTGGPGALDAIDRTMLEHGVTSYLAAIVTTDDETAARAVANAAERAADPASPLAGVHLEGPFLSPELPGVHPRELLRVPAQGVPDYVRDPCVRLVTLAPELDGALELVEELTERGVAVSLGHSAASPELAERAYAAGARCVTHVFNAMRPFHHRDPGLAGWALAHDGVAVGLIADGVHVDPVVLRVVRRAAGERVVLVSDVSPWTEPLAGSAITLDEAVRRWRRLAGAPLASAIAAASERPGALVGLEVGLRAGAPADLVLLGKGGQVERAMHAGRWLA